MTPADLAALRAAAEKATPGPWQEDAGLVPPDGPERYSDVYIDGGETIIANVNDMIPRGAANRAFIAAANPATILALLDMVDAARLAGWMQGREDAAKAVSPQCSRPCDCTGYDCICQNPGDTEKIVAWLSEQSAATTIRSLAPPASLAPTLAKVRRAALMEAAEVADTYDRELVRMAVDTWLTDPARHGDWTKPGVTAELEEEGWRKGERAETARHIAAAIRALAEKEAGDADAQ